MADDRSYVEVNARERERLRALVERLDDDTLARPANEYWTIAGVLGHLAHWDSRVLVFAEKIDRGEPWVPSDTEPEGDWVTDSVRPLIHALAPRAAADLALRIAEETDARVAELPLERMAPREGLSGGGVDPGPVGRIDLHDRVDVEERPVLLHQNREHDALLEGEVRPPVRERVGLPFVRDENAEMFGLAIAHSHPVIRV